MGLKHVITAEDMDAFMSELKRQEKKKVREAFRAGARVMRGIVQEAVDEVVRELVRDGFHINTQDHNLLTDAVRAIPLPEMPTATEGE